jgi:hypothetical protein
VSAQKGGGKPPHTRQAVPRSEWAPRLGTQEGHSTKTLAVCVSTSQQAALPSASATHRQGSSPAGKRGRDRAEASLHPGQKHASLWQVHIQSVPPRAPIPQWERTEGNPTQIHDARISLRGTIRLLQASILACCHEKSPATGPCSIYISATPNELTHYLQVPPYTRPH